MAFLNSSLIMKCLFDLFVTLEVTDVIALARHLVGMNRGLGAEPGYETAGGICAATFGYADRHQGEILLLIIIERWATPMALRVGWFLLHREDLTVCINLDYATLMETIIIGFVIAHDASGVLGLGIGQEALQAEG